MKQSLVFFLLLLCTSWGKAQQLPLQNQYNDLQGVINPAALNPNYLHSGYALNIGVNHRAQWVGVPNAPKTSTLYADYFFDSGSFGLISGAHIIKDQVSRIGVTGIYGKIGGVLSKDPQNYGLSLALSGGLVQYAVNSRDAKLIDTDDEAISLLTNNKLYPDVGFGVAYYSRLQHDDLLYAGFSVPQIFGLNLAYRNDDNQFDIKRLQHYYAQIGYLRNLHREATYLEFSSWVKYVKGAPVNIDLNVKYQVTSMLFFASGLNSAGVFNGQFGLELDNRIGNGNIIRLTYGFSSPFYGKNPYSGNSHEISLSIGLDK